MKKVAVGVALGIVLVVVLVVVSMVGADGQARFREQVNEMVEATS